MATVKTKLNIDSDALKKIKLVAVAYSFVDRDLFPNEEAYQAEKEVEDRAQEVMEEARKLGLEVKGYPGDQYLLTNLLVDRPDVIVNLVDTVRGKDKLASTIPAFLEYANIPFTGCGITGMVIGSNRHLLRNYWRLTRYQPLNISSSETCVQTPLRRLIHLISSSSTRAAAVWGSIIERSRKRSHKC